MNDWQNEMIRCGVDRLQTERVRERKREYVRVYRERGRESKYV